MVSEPAPDPLAHGLGLIGPTQAYLFKPGSVAIPVRAGGRVEGTGLLGGWGDPQGEGGLGGGRALL